MAVNRYPATCAECGARVETGAGRLTKEDGRWTVRHLACDDAGGSEVMEYYSPATGFYGTRNKRGLCEDAPCCGCCTF